MSKKHKRRSVAIQSTDFFNPDNEAGQMRVTLKKKPGFRNLLRQSMTIVSQRNEKENTHSFPGGQRSQGVQTAIETNFSYQGHKGMNQSLKSSFSKMQTFEQEDETRKTSSQVINVVDRKKEISNPGTSRMIPGGFSIESIVSQRNNTHQEGSLGVVYSYGERRTRNSITSTIYYGPQGSRRFSDETVLLIEDYQSYDQANAVRRQDLNFNRGKLLSCCTKNSRRSVEDSSAEALAKPLSLNIGAPEEIVCRVCHEGEEIEPLLQPCLCKGSVGSVHASCLKVWLEQSNTSRCELCNYPYAIRQTRKYTKCVSIRVFYNTIIDRRALVYDVISFVVITPLTLVGAVMCIQASVVSSGGYPNEGNYQIGYITKIGMAMLCGTIIVAYAVWLYTLISFHYKSWKKWYSNCYDVEVIPVRMTSEDRIQATRRLNEEMNRRHFSREHGSIIVTVPN